MGETKAGVREVLRREWWVVAAAVVAAVAVAAVLAWRGSGLPYEGRAVVRVDRVTLARTPFMPLPDDVISLLQDPDRPRPDGMAEARDVRFATIDSPVRRIVVTFGYPRVDAEGQQAVHQAGHWVAEAAAELASGTITAQREKVELTEGMMQVAAHAKGAGVETVESVARAWEMSRTLLEDRRLLAELEGAYQYAGDGTLMRVSGARGRAATLLGAGLAGLLAGLAVAWGRESALAGSRPHGDDS